MRAILRKQFGGSDVLEIREMPEPEPKIGHAVANENSTFMNAKMPEPYVCRWAGVPRSSLPATCYLY